MRSRGCCRRFCLCFPSVLSLVYLKKKKLCIEIGELVGELERSGRERVKSERKRERKKISTAAKQSFFC